MQGVKAKGDLSQTAINPHLRAAPGNRDKWDPGSAEEEKTWVNKILSIKLLEVVAQDAFGVIFWGSVNGWLWACLDCAQIIEN